MNVLFEPSCQSRRAVPHPEALRSRHIHIHMDRVSEQVESGKRVHGCKVVDTPMLNRQGEIAARPPHWTGEFESIALFAKRRCTGREGIACIFPGAAVGQKQRAMKG